MTNGVEQSMHLDPKGKVDSAMPVEAMGTCRGNAQKEKGKGEKMQKGCIKAGVKEVKGSSSVKGKAEAKVQVGGKVKARVRQKDVGHAEGHTIKTTAQTKERAKG